MQENLFNFLHRKSLRFSCDPKSKTKNLQPYSKEYSFRFMDMPKKAFFV